jgi:hypothetical protein
MDTKCYPVLEISFLFTYAHDFMSNIAKTTYNKSPVNLSYWFIDVFRSATCISSDYEKHPHRIYHEDTSTESLQLVISCWIGYLYRLLLSTIIFDTRDKFNFHIVQLPFLDN